ncbi:hypothetical protein QR680_012251 [Steinernema hermaphroditum]|uniref:phosphatidylinositol N-acetylglucosaminyltransferase n=1 Tax=Steinernema hermaphroditum TaxID=289476 RepID=A0AA39I1F8_9BILA|nr:hypothetical protein QR680_012251 [Steinernema hermaphroditum]
MNSGRLNIALVSDFFCPNAGGVETHIYSLGECLLKLGHRVIVITHAYGARKGIRFLTNGLKVYYLPFIVAYNGCSLMTMSGSLLWLRKIFLREKIQLVHGHSTFSTMAHEAMFNAWNMGIRTVFTDHSLFGFADASAILTNKLVLQYSLSNVDKVICVSHTSKENTVLRGGLSPQKVYVIPNAINTDLFTPDPELFHSNQTTVVFVGRLVYRKGADLLREIIPEICIRHPNVRFVIGGDGPKRIVLEEMREQYHLHDRVMMLGELPHNQVRNVLVQGQIFLNTSLTEAFCMAIVEAASCGLYVVTTKVGGIPEVLPEGFASTATPIPQLLCDALSEAIKMRESGELMDPTERHKAISAMYRWPEVAERTEIVYESAMREPDQSAAQRLRNYYNCGLGFGVLYIWVAIVNMIALFWINLFDPPKNYELADDRPTVTGKNKCQESTVLASFLVSANVERDKMGQEFSLTSVSLDNERFDEFRSSLSQKQRKLLKACFGVPPPRPRPGPCSPSSQPNAATSDPREAWDFKDRNEPAPVQSTVIRDDEAGNKAHNGYVEHLKSKLMTARHDRNYVTQRRQRGFAEARDSVNKEVKSPNGYSIITCLFCEGNHFTNSCYAYESYDQRRKRCSELGLCPNCAFREHEGTSCRLSHECRTCRKSGHASSMCRWYLDIDDEIRNLEEELERAIQR